MLADDADTAHLLDSALRVRDVPIARQKLHDTGSEIFDFDLIGPNVVILRRFGLILQIDRIDGYPDRVGGRGIHAWEAPEIAIHLCEMQ